MAKIKPKPSDRRSLVRDWLLTCRVQPQLGEYRREWWTPNWTEINRWPRQYQIQHMHDFWQMSSKAQGLTVVRVVPAQDCSIRVVRAEAPYSVRRRLDFSAALSDGQHSCERRHMRVRLAARRSRIMRKQAEKNLPGLHLRVTSLIIATSYFGCPTVSIVALLRAISAIHAWASSFWSTSRVEASQHVNNRIVSTRMADGKGVHISLSINGHVRWRITGLTVSFQMLDNTDGSTIQTGFLHDAEVLSDLLLFGRLSFILGRCPAESPSYSLYLITIARSAGLGLLGPLSMWSRPSTSSGWNLWSNKTSSAEGTKSDGNEYASFRISCITPMLTVIQICRLLENVRLNQSKLKLGEILV